MALSRPLLALAAGVAMLPVSAAAQTAWSALSPDQQIRLAVQAAPADMRDEATVQGYDESGALVTLRKGTNDLICMAPDPQAKGLEVSCHHAGLERFFARGRELIAQGITGNERLHTRWEEHDQGKLPIPYGSVNYILTGSGFDVTTGEISDPYMRWTIYVPGATPQSTGFSTQPTAGGPWLMMPGTAGAHVMITPPRSGGGA